MVNAAQSVLMINTMNARAQDNNRKVNPKFLQKFNRK